MLLATRGIPSMQDTPFVTSARLLMNKLFEREQKGLRPLMPLKNASELHDLVTGLTGANIAGSFTRMANLFEKLGPITEADVRDDANSISGIATNLYDMANALVTLPPSIEGDWLKEVLRRKELAIRKFLMVSRMHR